LCATLFQLNDGAYDVGGWKSQLKLFEGAQYRTSEENQLEEL